MLRENGVEGQLYFKPAFTSGGKGILSVTSLDDLEAINMDAALKSMFGEKGGVSEAVKAEYGFTEEINPPFILEECITAAPAPSSPVMQALGNTVLPCCDQLLEGETQIGTVFPSSLPESVQDSCKAAFEKLRTILGDQRGFSGVDFVIEAGSLDPVLVDLNMARPNWSHYFLMFRDGLPEKPPVWVGRRASFRHAAEQGINYSAILLRLKEACIDFDYTTGRGVALIQSSIDTTINSYVTKMFVAAGTIGEFHALNDTLDRLVRESDSFQM
jgi:hypothetical protein